MKLSKNTYGLRIIQFIMDDCTEFLIVCTHKPQNNARLLRAYHAYDVRVKRLTPKPGQKHLLFQS